MQGDQNIRTMVPRSTFLFVIKGVSMLSGPFVSGLVFSCHVYSTMVEPV